MECPYPAIPSWIVFLVAVEYFQEESSCKMGVFGYGVKVDTDNIAIAELEVWFG